MRRTQSRACAEDTFEPGVCEVRETMREVRGKEAGQKPDPPPLAPPIPLHLLPHDGEVTARSATTPGQARDDNRGQQRPGQASGGSDGVRVSPALWASSRGSTSTHKRGPDHGPTQTHPAVDGQGPTRNRLYNQGSTRPRPYSSSSSPLGRPGLDPAAAAVHRWAVGCAAPRPPHSAGLGLPSSLSRAGAALLVLCVG